MYPKRCGYSQQVAEFHFLTGLHALQRVPGYPGGFPQALLRPVEFHASDADAVPDCPAGIDDPVGLFGRHTNNAGWKLILCQPQFWGVV